MSKEHCIVCLDKYKGSKEEHLENCRRFPVFATTNIPPKDDISRLYLMDMDHIEFSYCDCIAYDRNGNPNCRIHQGRLQEFYAKPKVLSVSTRQSSLAKYHLIKDGKPYCNFKKIDDQKFIITKEHITCKNCLNCEKKDREREMEAYKLIGDKDGFYYTFGELELGSKEVGKVKDVQ